MKHALRVVGLLGLWMTLAAPGPIYIPSGAGSSSPGDLGPFFFTLLLIASLIGLPLAAALILAARKQVLEFIVVLDDASRQLPDLDAAFTKSRFGDSGGGRKGIRRMLESIDRKAILGFTLRRAGRGSTAAMDVFTARMTELGLKKLSARKRLARRSATPARCDDSCILGILVTLPTFAKVSTDLTLDQTLDMLTTAKSVSPVYVYVAPDPNGRLSGPEALEWLASQVPEVSAACPTQVWSRADPDCLTDQYLNADRPDVVTPKG